MPIAAAKEKKIMNVEIANRLYELRKKNDLSQEELAEKLHLTRQAVSKWERAESAPDTDTVICLAKIYGVSLDELLRTSEKPEDIINDATDERQSFETKEKEDQKETKTRKTKSYVHIGQDGIHVIDDGDEVHISGAGVHVVDGDKRFDFGPEGVHCGNIKIERKYHNLKQVVTGLTALLATIAYILMGSFLGLWHPGWIIFLAIPVVESIISVIVYRRVTKLAYPIIVVIAYLLIGFLLGGWHPWWVLFLTIPVFYMTFSPLERLWLKDKTINIDGFTIRLDEVGIHKDDDKDEDE